MPKNRLALRTTLTNALRPAMKPCSAFIFRATIWLHLLAAGLLATTRAPGASSSPSPAATNQIAAAIEIAGVHNAFRATEKLYSGSQPEGDATFAALAQRGIKTIISVDGGKPDVAAARKHGLRYIHLPYGYDGISTNRVAELITVMQREPGPFYVHCHHGKHRGPAAIAVMALAAEGWTTNQAVAWLREAGTADDYPGLYRAAQEFFLPTETALAAVGELPEVAQASSLVEAMVAVDAHLEHLKLAQKSGWKTPPGHADISPPHEATLLWEQYREIARLADTAARPADYRQKLAEAERLTDALRQELKTGATGEILDAMFKRVSQNCVACHKQHRNK
jgi:protein tyrosine phosphatase (PTP) superfamily phosphohydrolase (DUF442 family)